MIKTYKIKHNRNLIKELEMAHKVACFAIRNRDKLSSSYVKHIGLKSAISNQILRKYGKNRKCRVVSRVNLIAPNQSIKTVESKIIITPLKLELNASFLPFYTKINQIELDDTYAYVSLTIQEAKPIIIVGSLGVDRNTTGHCVACVDNINNKVILLGKQAQHIHTKYSNIRRRLQRLGKFKKLKTIKKRESNKVKDLNHKISRKVVDYARDNKLAIKLEDLKSIRKTSKQRKSFRYSLNSWSYYQLQLFLEYKAKELGVPVIYIAPHYTSKSCSKCGHVGNRQGKIFKCTHCGHVTHADVNAAYNIANLELGDCIKKKIDVKGVLTTRKEQGTVCGATPRTQRALAVGVVSP